FSLRGSVQPGGRGRSVWGWRGAAPSYPVLAIQGESVTTRIKKVSAAVAVAAAMAAVPAVASAVTSDGHRTPAAGRSVVLDASQTGFAAKAGAAAKSAADTAKRPVT